MIEEFYSLSTHSRTLELDGTNTFDTKKWGLSFNELHNAHTYNKEIKKKLMNKIKIF